MPATSKRLLLVSACVLSVASLVGACKTPQSKSQVKDFEASNAAAEEPSPEVKAAAVQFFEE